MSSLLQAGSFMGISYTIHHVDDHYDVVVETRPQAQERSFFRTDNARKWVEFCIKNMYGRCNYEDID